MSATADRITTIPRPNEPIPLLSWPVLGVFAAAAALYAGGIALAVTDAWPAPLSTLVNGVAAFLFFTVAHEASHSAASSSAAVNRWLGRVALPFFVTVGGFAMFRFIHMQHHRFTNHTDGSDPDHYTQAGPALLLPLRWATIDLQYLRFYVPRLQGRPAAERRELAVSTALVLAVYAALVAAGHGLDLLLLVVLPGRIALFLLAWSFDWLPHHGLHDTARTNRFRTTRNIVGRERLLTPLMLYQNYHLVHHLHPVIPFHRYIAVWRRHEAAYLAHDPALVDPRGRPVTAAELRELRRLDHEH
ncbi:fatty acid desaturase [Patulibacter sp. S7RM1-6]